MERATSRPKTRNRTAAVPVAEDPCTRDKVNVYTLYCCCIFMSKSIQTKTIFFNLFFLTFLFFFFFLKSEREFNPDIHCGVMDMTARKPCTRSLTCKVCHLLHFEIFFKLELAFWTFWPIQISSSYLCYYQSFTNHTNHSQTKNHSQ